MMRSEEGSGVSEPQSQQATLHSPGNFSGKSWAISSSPLTLSIVSLRPICSPADWISTACACCSVDEAMMLPVLPSAPASEISCLARSRSWVM